MAVPPVFGRMRPLRGALGSERAPEPRARAAAASANLSDAAFPNPLPLAVPKQDGKNWCWAAVAMGIGDLFNVPGLPSQQCEFVTRVFRLPPGRCCADPKSRECDLPGALDSALFEIDCYRPIVNGTVNLAFVQSEIAGGRPIGVRVRRTDGSAHFMAMSGWWMGGSGEPWVRLHDPWERTIDDMPLAALHSSAKGVWTHSYPTKRPGPGHRSALVAPPETGPLGG